MSIFARLVLVSLVIQGAELAAQPKPFTGHAVKATAQVTLPEQELAEAYQKVAPSVVRVSWKHHRNIVISRSGVILTADGYVVTSGFYPSSEPDDLQPGKAVSINLSDGRTVEGQAVTSSLNWGIVKISEAGNWPVALTGDSEDLKLGDWCLSLGFDSPPVKNAFTTKPSLHVGRVSAKGEKRWLGTTHHLGGGTERGSGLFDLRGNLLGIYTAAGDRPYRVFASIHSLNERWDDLIAKDRDYQRALMKNESQAAPPPSPEDPELRPAATLARQYTVRIDRDEEGPGVSGTLISRHGHVATCDHHGWAPDTEVTVHLPHYSSKPLSVRGRVLGSDTLLDIGLVRITQGGPWRHTQFANASEVKPGDLCIALGYPVHLQREGPFCVTRSGRIVNTWFAPQQLESSCQVDGGMSGGGLFNKDGRFLAVHKGPGNSPDTTWHRTSNLFRQHWQFLLEGPETTELLPFEETKTARTLLDELSSVEARIVEILPLERDVTASSGQITLGTVVSCEGHILTKASQLFGGVSCRLSDGRQLPAQLVKVSRELDLALLKIEAKNVPAIRWSEHRDILPGQVLAVADGVGPPALATVSQLVHDVPNVPGWLVVGKISEGKGGVRVDELFGIWSGGSPLAKGDVITHVEGHQTPNVQALNALTVQEGAGWGVRFVNAGDPIRVGVLREGKAMDFHYPLLHAHWDRQGHRSRRCAGFSAVFDLDVYTKRSLKTHCGGPVLDGSGQVLGITIARAGENRLFVVPAGVAQSFVAAARR